MSGATSTKITSWEDDIWGSIIDGIEVRLCFLRRFFANFLQSPRAWTPVAEANIAIIIACSDYSKECVVLFTTKDSERFGEQQR